MPAPSIFGLVIRGDIQVFSILWDTLRLCFGCHYYCSFSAIKTASIIQRHLVRLGEVGMERDAGGRWGLEGEAELQSPGVPKGGWLLVFRSFLPPPLGCHSGLARAVAGREPH